MLSVSCGGCFIAKSGLTAVTPADYILPSSSVHGILQARILEWVAISFSRGSSQPRVEPGSPALQADFYPVSYKGKCLLYKSTCIN